MLPQIPTIIYTLLPVPPQVKPPPHTTVTPSTLTCNIIIPTSYISNTPYPDIQAPHTPTSYQKHLVPPHTSIPQAPPIPTLTYNSNPVPPQTKQTPSPQLLHIYKHPYTTATLCTSTYKTNTTTPTPYMYPHISIQAPKHNSYTPYTSTRHPHMQSLHPAPPHSSTHTPMQQQHFLANLLIRYSLY